MLSRDAAKARLDFLYGKQQKVSKYRTKKERDDALKLEIATFAQYEKSQRLFIETQNKLKQDLEKRLQDIEKEGERLLTSAEDGRDKIRETTAKIASILEEKAGLSEQMK
jgi:structural maintenance of chromosome 3 (chondroitin sulfate proteoglycan 6)